MNPRCPIDQHPCHDHACRDGYCIRAAVGKPGRSEAEIAALKAEGQRIAVVHEGVLYLLPPTQIKPYLRSLMQGQRLRPSVLGGQMVAQVASLHHVSEITKELAAEMMKGVS